MWCLFQWSDFPIRYVAIHFILGSIAKLIFDAAQMDRASVMLPKLPFSHHITSCSFTFLDLMEQSTRSEAVWDRSLRSRGDLSQGFVIYWGWIDTICSIRISYTIHERNRGWLLKYFLFRLKRSVATFWWWERPRIRVWGLLFFAPAEDLANQRYVFEIFEDIASSAGLEIKK